MHSIVLTEKRTALLRGHYSNELLDTMKQIAMKMTQICGTRYYKIGKTIKRAGF